VAQGTSALLVDRIRRRSCVVNTQNAAVGKRVRRGDGTLGELVPMALAIQADGFLVARGPVANIQVGAETKILAKAMIKQIDRVTNDLVAQAKHFLSTGGNPITVALVGINYAPKYTSFEGDRAFPTTGSSGHRHPIQEADEARTRVLRIAEKEFTELLVLPFRASNEPPFPFEWVDPHAIQMEYSAMLLRVSREYDRRFT